MYIDVISIFPEMFDAVANFGILSRARKQGLWSLNVWNPRDFSDNSYRRVDDRPYGGGAGMVMQPEPLRRAIYAALSKEKEDEKRSIIALSPQGRLLTQEVAAEFAALKGFVLLAGRYEAVDQRLIDTLVDEEISVGDFVVSGGELPAMLFIEAVVRLLPGALEEESVRNDSFSNGLLDCPHYTRPFQWEGMNVPDILLSGNHQKIQEWRHQQSLLATYRKRPDLIRQARLFGLLSLKDEIILSDMLSL